jgi:hypothetical protein
MMAKVFHTSSRGMRRRNGPLMGLLRGRHQQVFFHFSLENLSKFQQITHAILFGRAVQFRSREEGWGLWTGDFSSEKVTFPSRKLKNKSENVKKTTKVCIFFWTNEKS